MINSLLASLAWLAIAIRNFLDCLWLCCFGMKFYILLGSKLIGRTIIYGDILMMIFILASGYLLSVYLLLALAKRTCKKDVAKI